MKDFDWKFWIGTVGGAIGIPLFLAYLTWRGVVVQERQLQIQLQLLQNQSAMAPAQNQTPRPAGSDAPASSSWWPELSQYAQYWPIGVMALLIAVNATVAMRHRKGLSASNKALQAERQRVAELTSLQVELQKQIEALKVPTLQLFEHAKGNPQTVDKVRRLFEKAGYRLEIGKTDLSRHASGITLHGGTNTNREHARWALASLGLFSPTVDYTDDKPPHLQIIVGELRAQPTQPPPPLHTEPVTSGSLLQKLNPIVTTPTQGRVSLSGLGLRLRVYIVPNTGGTPGGSLKVVNESADAVEGVTVTVTDLRIWNQQLGKFVTLPDIHGESSKFPQDSVLHHKNTLHPGAATDFGLIRVEGNRLSIEGSRDYRSTQEGIWELKYRIGPNPQAFVEGRICFEWHRSNDTGQPPALKQCDCPKSM